jgi:hypothetical protein
MSAEPAAKVFADHLAQKAAEARLRYGLCIDAEAILAMLQDRSVVRWPARLDFDAGPLAPGEFGWPEPLGPRPADGFRLCLHPHFAPQPENWALLAAYHLPTINYGAAAGPEDAELFGATLLGLDVETYYRALCELADSIPAGPPRPGGAGRFP